MNRIDFTNLGGFPFEEDTLKFMQDNYAAVLSGIAKLCGNKTILCGVVVTGGNVSDGWISYNGELIQFVGGLSGAQVVINEVPNATQATFQDGTQRDVYFTKTATCGAVGDFPFSDLVPLLAFQNTWRPGDIKERYLEPTGAAAYIAANFDVSGFGITPEQIGWRILSKAVPSTAGKTFVNVDFADPDFSTIGGTTGEKKHTLTPNEFTHSISIPRGDSYAGNANQTDMKVGGGLGPNPQTPIVIKIGNANGIVDGHNNIQPSYIILKLIKL